MLATLAYDLRYAVRRLAGMPGFSLAAVAMLALGIAFSVTMFCTLYGVLLRRTGRARLLIGVPLALLWGRLLASELVGISPYDAASFAVAAAVLLVVVFCAAFGPARRALKVAPTIALRCE